MSYYFAIQTFFGSVKKPAFASLRRAKGYGAAGAALRSTIYFAMQMFFGSVKKPAYAKATARQAQRFVAAFAAEAACFHAAERDAQVAHCLIEPAVLLG